MDRKSGNIPNNAKHNIVCCCPNIHIIPCRLTVPAQDEPARNAHAPHTKEKVSQNAQREETEEDAIIQNSRYTTTRIRSYAKVPAAKWDELMET